MKDELNILPYMMWLALVCPKLYEYYMLFVPKMQDEDIPVLFSNLREQGYGFAVNWELIENSRFSLN